MDYQWFKDGTVIQLKTGSLCCTSAASNGPPHYYIGRLINSCGKGEAATTVTVCGSPTVTVSPQSSTYSGSPVTLTASAQGCQPFTYQWYIGDAPSGSPTGTNSSSLTVSPATTTHYWVRVTDNVGGTGNSNTAIVTVSTPLPTPGALTAAFSPATNTVTVSWGASSGADHYQLQRLDHGVWGSPSDVYALSASYTLSANTTYVFHVRTVDSSGGSASSYTANDLATTMSFAALQTNVTVVNFDHFEQIRTAINAILAAQSGAALSWRQILDASGFSSVPVPDHNARVYAAHILSLRNSMNAALGGVQVAVSGYSDSLTTPTLIKALHITQLQQRAQ